MSLLVDTSEKINLPGLVCILSGTFCGTKYKIICINDYYQELTEYKWRRGRDSNPRRAFNPYSLSRGALSTTQPPLQVFDFIIVFRFLAAS
jgi:hypothetical protein